MTTLAVDVLWRDRGATAGAEKLGRNVDKAGRSFSGLKTLAAGAAIGAGAALIRFGRDSVVAFGDAEKAQARLSFAFQRFPRLADTNQAALQSLNSEMMKKTRFDDDALASGQAVLAQFNLTGKQITDVTPLLADYAAKTGKDIPTAAKDLGRSLMGNTRALKGIGIDYTSTGNAGKDFANITDLVRQKVGGFAEQEGKTAAGQLEILRNQFGELQEQAGAKLVPALTSVVGGLIKVVGFVDRNQAAIVPLVVGVGGLAAVIWTANKATVAWNISQGFISGLAGRAVAGLSLLKTTFTGVGISATGAARAVKIAQLSIPLVGVALFAVTSAMQFFASRSEDASAEANSFADAMTSVRGNVTRATAALNENVRAVAVQTLQSSGAFAQAKLLGLSYADVTDAALGNKAAIERVNTVLGRALELNPQVSQANSDQRNSASKLSESLGGVARESIEATQAERDRRSAMAPNVAVTDELKVKTDALKTAQRSLNSELQKSIDKFTILREGALSTERANLAWEESVDAVRTSVKENGRSLDSHTAKGRSNRNAVINMATALNDKVTADVKSAGATRKGETAQQRYERVQKTATKSTKDGIAKIKEHAEAAGLDKDQVNRMIKEFVKTPAAAGKMGKGVEGASKEYRGLDDDINALNSKKVGITFSTNAPDVAKKYGVVLQGSSASAARRQGRGDGPEHHIGSNLSSVIGPPASFPKDHPAWGGPSVGVSGSVGRPGTKSVPPAFNRMGDAVALGVGKHLGKAISKRLQAQLEEMDGTSGAPGGSVGSRRVGPGWGPIQSAMRRHGSTTFNTYPGHHPSMARARDVYPHSWAAANAARALSSVWYVIYRMKIASKNHGNVWRQYRPTNFRGDWRHVRHIHVARYDRGGHMLPGQVGINTSRQPERVLTTQQTKSFDRHVRLLERTGGAVSYHVTIQAPNFVGSQTDLRDTLVSMARRGDLDVVRRVSR